MFIPRSDFSIEYFRTQNNKQEKQQTWKEKMLSAAEVAEAKSQGSVPGVIKRLIDNIELYIKNSKLQQS